MQAPALEVRGLSRAFGRIAAISELDLTVHPGDVYGFLGPNGAGKTTAIRCMLGLIRRDAGSVTFFGEDDPVRARASIGAIVETPVFYGWMSARDNLRQAAAWAGLSGKEAQSEVARVLDRVGLSGRERDRARTYSLGMKQRLGIARALLGHPRMLILDEPTNGLDPRGMTEVRELIRSLARNEQITILVSSHLLSEVQQVCNRVGILSAGRLQAEGQVDELIAASRGSFTLDLDAEDPGALRRALDLRPDVDILEHSDGSGLRVRTETGPGQLNRELGEAGIFLTTLTPVTRNLEDVFLEVTT